MIFILYYEPDISIDLLLKVGLGEVYMFLHLRGGGTFESKLHPPLFFCAITTFVYSTLDEISNNA